MRYDIGTTDWESQTFYVLEGPSLSNEEWNSLWGKAVEEAAKIFHKKYNGFIDGEMLVDKTVEVLVEKHGFARSSGERTKYFQLAGVNLKDIPQLGEYVPKELLPKERKRV